MIRKILMLSLLAAVGLAPGCGLLGGKLADERPPLADMEEPLDWQQEPQDEDARRELPRGAFTGVYVAANASSLDDLAGGGDGVLVERVVENSPGAAAGIESGDVILEATWGAADGPRAIGWPSEWRKLEIESPPGQTVTVLLDRAGVEKEVRLVPAERLAAPDRVEAERFREEARVGIVLRTATEVEARAAGLGPGGGAVIVGLSRASPWRAAGLQFGDLIVEIDGAPVSHPQVILEAIRAAEEGHEFSIAFARAGAASSVGAGVSSRRSELQRVQIPPFFCWEEDHDASEWSVLLGLIGHKSTKAAWEFKLLWFITFRGGDSDELEEVEEVQP